MTGASCRYGLEAATISESWRAHMGDGGQGMRTLRGLAGSVAAVAVLAAALLTHQAPGASASTVSDLKWLPGSASCGSDPTLHPMTLMVPGNGAFTPVFFPETNKTLVPYQVRYNLLDPGDGLKTRHDVNFLLGQTVTKSAPIPAGSVTCELSGTLVIDKQAYGFTGTVTGPLR